MSTDRMWASTRRRFLRFLGAIGVLALESHAAPPAAGSGAAAGAPNADAPRPVMPPGAGDRVRFSARCTACHLCVARCPTQILRPAAMEYGWSGLLQPRMDFTHASCPVDCRECSRVCPTQALRPLTPDEKKRVRVGVVRHSWNRCVVRNERRACDLCIQACPTGAITARPWRTGINRPSLRTELCTGCGACEAVCPARPARAMIIHGLDPQEWIPDRSGDSGENAGSAPARITPSPG